MILTASFCIVTVFLSQPLHVLPGDYHIMALHRACTAVQKIILSKGFTFW